MPTTPRYTHRLTTVSSSILAKKITQTFLDTKPGSPLRSRLEDIMLNRINAAAVTSARYYTASLQGLGEVLKAPGFPPFHTPARPQRLYRTLKVPVRSVHLPRYSPLLRKTPAGTVRPGIAGHLNPENKRYAEMRNTKKGMQELKIEGYPSKTRIRGPYKPSSQGVKSSVSSLGLKFSITSDKGIKVFSKAKYIQTSPNYQELSQRHLPRIPVTEHVTVESGAKQRKAWKALGFNYRYGLGFWKGYQESKSFWRKTGRLSRSYDTWLATNLPRLSDPSLYVGPSIANKVTYANPKGAGSRARLAHITFSIKPPALNMTVARELDYTLQRSFIRGTPVEIGPPTMRAVTSKRVRVDGRRITLRAKKGEFLYVSNAAGLERLHSPEYHRPFAARYMAEMGRRYESTLRNVLKPR